MKRNTRKGFTGIELVIVIAIIAILAATLIPTFSGLIKSANVTADKQEIRSMNAVLLAAAITEGFENPSDAIDVLYAQGWNAGKMQAYTKDYKYAYNHSDNKMYLIDDKGEVVFPEAADKSNLWGFYNDSVSDMIHGVYNYIAMKNITNVDNFRQSFATGTYKIDLNSYFIDLKGDETAYNATVTNGAYISGNVTKGEGAKGYTTLAVSAVEANQTYQNVVLTGYKTGSTCKTLPAGVSFTDCVIYDSSMATAGSATFTNCTFVGGVSVAAIYVNGAPSDAVINIKNCTFENSVRRVINVTSPCQVNIEGCVFNGTSTDEKHIIQIANADAKFKIDGCTFNALGTSPSIIRIHASMQSKYTNLHENVTFTNNTIASDIPVEKYVDMDGIETHEANALDDALTNKMK